MAKKKLKEIVNRPEMIPGIYNYCDRWCEKCYFTERCSAYAIEDEAKADGAAKDWADRVDEMFKIAMELLQEVNLKEGLNPEVIISKPSDGAKMIDNDDMDDDDPKLKLSWQYAEEASDWLEEFYLGMAGLEDWNTDDRPGITEAIEIIMWYKHQIYTKLKRAADSKIFDNEDEFTSTSDANGSAKVALIGIERSIAAWGSLFTKNGEDESILGILANLALLKKLTDKAFPEAKNFRRPGFDD